MIVSCLTGTFGDDRGKTLPEPSGDPVPAGPELFIGLVGAVGTDLGSVSQHIKDELHRVGYSADIIRLSDLLLDTDRFATLRELRGGPEDHRINQLMTAGDDFRSEAKRGDAVALLAIGKVRDLRELRTGSPD